MKEYLVRERKNSDTVFHFMGTHKLNYHYYARKIKSNTVVCTHLGGSNPYWKFQHKRKIVNYIYYLFENIFY